MYRKKKNMLKTVVAIAVALAFMLPVSSIFADIETVDKGISDSNMEVPVFNAMLDSIALPEGSSTGFCPSLYKKNCIKEDLNGDRSVGIIYPLIFSILQQENIEIIGNANGQDFGYYTVTYFKAKYDDNSNFFHRYEPKELINSSTPVTNDAIAVWNTTLEQGDEHYWLVLDVYDTNSGIIDSDELVVYVEDDTLIQNGWPLELISHGSLSSFNAIDVDYDGDLELFVGNSFVGSDPNFYAWHHNGNLLDNWPVAIPGSGGTYSSPAIGDLDNDGVMEIAVTVGQRIYVYHPDGSLVFSYSTNQGGCLFPSIGDVDNDGYLEIIFRGCDPVLYVFTSTGNHYDGYPLYLDEPPYPEGGGSKAQSVGDINGDGFLDVVFGTNCRKLYAYTLYNQEPVDGFPLDIPGVAYGPVLGDIDNDGDIEIIAAVEDYPRCNMYVWNDDGTIYPGWPRNAHAVSGGENPQIASLGDIDDDGDLEIFFTSYWHKMFAWHHDGSNVNGWPKDNIGEWIFTQPVIGDIDGDGTVDIITQSRHSQTNSIIAFNNQGEILDGFPKEIVSQSWRVYNSAPLLADLDKDGDIEIVSRSQDQWEEGEFLLRVKIWDLQSEYNISNMEWPMFQRDSYNTGCYRKISDNITIEISGGFGVSAVITNDGEATATNVEWIISVTGGILGLIDVEATDTIASLAVGEEVTVSTGIFFGLGPIVVTVTVACTVESAIGKQLIIFTRI